MKDLSGILKSINRKKFSGKKNETVYAPSGLLRTIYNTEEDFAKTERLFQIAQQSLAGVNLNDKFFTEKLLRTAAVALNKTALELDEKTCSLMKEIAAESELRESGKKFLEKFC